MAVEEAVLELFEHRFDGTVYERRIDLTNWVAWRREDLGRCDGVVFSWQRERLEVWSRHLEERQLHCGSRANTLAVGA